MPEDIELLRDYARNRTESAFAELVQRHVDLVYSAALRETHGDSAQAEDIAQAVFTELARKAATLVNHPALAGWLYTCVRQMAANARRANERRQRREQEAHEMNAFHSANSTESPWREVQPVIDDAMHELSEIDRTAVVLRYFENRSHKEVGLALGLSETAARKRVDRALEELRSFLTRRGVAVGAAGLTMIISANAVQAAPIGLVASISTAAALAAPAVLTTSFTTSTLIAMTTLQKTIVGFAVAVAVGAGIYEAREIARLRGEVQALETRQSPLANRLAQLERDYDDATNRLAALKNDNERLNGNTAELLKLRGELARAREDNRALTPAESNAKAWAARVAFLKEKLEQMPARKIPELQFVSEKDWANAVWDADLTTEDGVREALSKVREEAVNTFMNRLRTAIKKYADTHEGMLPDNITGLASYFDPPITDAENMLKRYQLVQSGKLSDNPRAPLARLLTYADEDYDSNHEITLNGASGGRFNRIQGAVDSAARAFAAANGGRFPNNATDLAPYLGQPMEDAAVQKYLKEFNANPPPPEVITLGPALKAYSAAHNGHSPGDSLALVPFLSTLEQEDAFLKLERIPPDMAILISAVKAYAAEHNGVTPKDFPDLRPYAQTPTQQAALQRLEQMKKPGAQ